MDKMNIVVENRKPIIHVTIENKSPVIKSTLVSGARGKSAYEVWLDQGNEGTEQDFLSAVNKYTHPDKHSADMITETTEKQFISSADKSKISGYTHDQIKSSKRWLVYHSLGKFPSVSVIDSAGNLVVGEVEYISNEHIILTFSHEFSGKAFLN